MGRQLRNRVPVFHIQLNPQWPDLENLREKESMSKLKQQTLFNSRHKAKLLPLIGSGTEVFVKDLQCSGKVIEAAVTPQWYKVETPASTIRRNLLRLTPLPDQQENEQLNPEEKQVPAESKAATPIHTFLFLGDFRVSPEIRILATRPKRVIRPSLKVRENLGLAL